MMEKVSLKMITTSFTICNNTLEISVKSEKKTAQYPEFGHTQGEIQKEPAKKYNSIQEGREEGNSGNRPF